jgi:glycosyltransferase involved in cell wall biosynthesis|tara:strand:- start:5198 stop:5920 length:723 start_codon:yes stop_codon:yes gene_type:complete
MKYTVAMTVYGKSPYLKKQLDSIVNQSIPPTQIVIVEDYSGISANEYINDLINNFDVPCKLITNSFNLGPAKSFKKALLASDYDYVYFSDQDDIWNENRVSKTIEFLKDSFLVACNAEVFYSNDKTSHNLYSCNQFKNVNVSKLIYKNFVVGATLAINIKNHRNLIKKISFEPMHDLILTIMCILDGKKIKFVDLNLISYRRHSMTLTGNKKNSISKKIKFRIHILFFVIFFFVHKATKI